MAAGPVEAHAGTKVKDGEDWEVVSFLLCGAFCLGVLSPTVR